MIQAESIKNWSHKIDLEINNLLYRLLSNNYYHRFSSLCHN